MMDRQALLSRLSPEKRALLLRRLREQQAPRNEPAGRPALAPDPVRQYDPFPLTDLQRAYWLGRTDALPLGNLASRGYLEIDCVDLDLERLERGWQRLVARHDMLRVVVTEDGQQRVLREAPPYRIPVTDLKGLDPGAQGTRLDGILREMMGRLCMAAEWPLFALHASRLSARRTRLHVAVELLNVDAGSVGVLFRELAALLDEPPGILPPLELSFRDYVLARRRLESGDAFARAREYWTKRLPTLAGPPDLPMAPSPAWDAAPRFTRRTARLDAAVATALKARAGELGVTLSALCLLVYAEVLAAWSRGARFTINIPILNRLPVHEQVHDVVGVFTSVLLFEADLTAQETFAQRARRVQSQLLDDLAHREFDGVAVQRELARLRGPAGAVMPVVFTSLIDHRLAESVGRLGTFVRGLNQTAQVWMDLHVDEQDGQLMLHWDAVDGLFPEGLVGDMLDACVRRLAHVATESGTAADAGFSFPPAAQIEQRRQANDTAFQVPDLLLHAPFVEQARRAPDRIAVAAGERRITYGDLARHANRLGRHLRALGLGPNMLVAVVMEKGWEQVVATLGILHAGCAYLPVDATLPAERLRYLLEHGDVKVALTQSWVDGAIDWPAGVRRLRVDADPLFGVSEAPLDPLHGPGDLAYVIFTSGSTGLPKGVMIDHRGALNTVLDVNRRFSVGPDDRVFALSSLSFDLSVYDIFGVLAAGGTIVMPSSKGLRDPAHWVDLLTREKVTIWNSVPALMAMLVEYVADRPEGLEDSLRLVLLSGDWIPVTLPDRLRVVAPDARVVGLGGATEASIWSILFPIDAVDPQWKSIPYGRPMVNQTFHVLDEGLEPRPTWVPGQLHIGGTGLAHGYWRDEAKTRASFIQHPPTGERLYRTGDLGRYLPDGNIEFLGRDDGQVKVQGYRVELAEIETALATHPGVKSAMAVAVGERHGQKRLVAYVVPSQSPAPTTEELRRFLLRKLPDYMVPTSFRELESLPLTSNGKIDRRAAPELASVEPPPDASPAATPLVRRVTDLVREALNLEQLDADANLLSRGASSIDLIRIGNQLEKTFGDRPSMEQLFRRQTPRDLAAYYAEKDQPPRATVATGPPALGLIDPATRLAFRDSRPGLRRIDGAGPSIGLVASAADQTLARGYLIRRTHRAFSPHPVPFDRFGCLLECLKPVVLDGRPKYLYGSAGALYPNQVYIHSKPGRVGGVPAGTYYYHPAEHRLVPLAAGVELDRDLHVPFVNQPVFDQAAFSLFIVAELGAIAPEYGDWSLHFATIEAGLMTQLLETAAGNCGIGLCQIGSIEFDRIRGLFQLGATHRLIHSLVGGSAQSEEGLL